MKHYFENKESEYCHRKKYFNDLMIERGVKSMIVINANRLTGEDMMLCKKYMVMGEKGNCGNICKDYKPRNGKSGNCLHTGVLYEKGDETKIFLTKRK